MISYHQQKDKDEKMFYKTAFQNTILEEEEKKNNLHMASFSSVDLSSAQTMFTTLHLSSLWLNFHVHHRKPKNHIL